MRNKYGAIKTMVDGIKFDSKIESERYVMLKEMEERGEIYGLRRQTEFDMYVNKEFIGKYTCDFDYMSDQGRVVEDVKGMAPNAAVRLRLKLVKALFGIDVQIWPKKPRKARKPKKVAA